MASRSFKPSSLANYSKRPSFARTSSSSSSHSQAPDEATHSRRASSSTDSDGSTTPVPNHHLQVPNNLHPNSPGSRRSRPIAIQLPSRHSAVRTPPAPLTGRGEVKGSYFPFHGDIQGAYKPHPFHSFEENSRTSAMPERSSPLFTPNYPTSPGRTTVKSPLSMGREVFPGTAGPETLGNSMGQFHPSNFKMQPPSPSSRPSANSHKRNDSDIRKKLQEYQRDMMRQATLASRMGAKGTKPSSPRLEPLGSPGPITPLELEEGNSYMTARAPTSSPNASAEQELVSNIIRADHERRNRSGNRSGPTSPAALVR